jgi:predicted O-methyltransferase YrrM
MTSPMRSEPPAGTFRDAFRRVLFPSPRPPQRSARSLLAYGAKGVVGVAATLGVFLGGFVRTRHRAHLNAFLGEIGIGPARIATELPTVTLRELPGEENAIHLHEAVATDGNVTLLELLVIARLVAAVKPKVVFEIGTFDGRTTLNIAANTGGEVFTLDLPAADLESTKLPIDPSDASYIDKSISGARFLERPERRRINQLFGDSANFDFTRWHGGVDFIFVDGAHSREYVLNDTNHALRLLRQSGGIILWHDYDAAFDGVTTALHQIAKRGIPLRRIEGTSLAILMADGDTPRSIGNDS